MTMNEYVCMTGCGPPKWTAAGSGRIRRLCVLLRRETGGGAPPSCFGGAGTRPAAPLVKWSVPACGFPRTRNTDPEKTTRQEKGAGADTCARPHVHQRKEMGDAKKRILSIMADMADDSTNRSSRPLESFSMDRDGYGHGEPRLEWIRGHRRKGSHTTKKGRRDDKGEGTGSASALCTRPSGLIHPSTLKRQK